MTRDPAAADASAHGLAEATLRAEALRVYHRYATEIVEAYSLCPYARRAREEGHVAVRVLLEPAMEDALLVQHIDELAADSSIEIGLLLLPRLDLEPLAFEHRVQALRRLHQAGPRGLVMALEAFHPLARIDTSEARRLIPWLRRTPDPTIQLARRSVLEELRASRPTGTGLVDLDAIEALLATTGADLARLTTAPREALHERIAETNLRTVERDGGARLGALLEDILADRNRAYAAIDGLAPPAPWRDTTPRSAS